MIQFIIAHKTVVAIAIVIWVAVGVLLVKYEKEYEKIIEKLSTNSTERIEQAEENLYKIMENQEERYEKWQEKRALEKEEDKIRKKGFS